MSGAVAPGGRQAIEPGALGILFRPAAKFAATPAPRLECGVLQRAAVAEAQGPRQRPELVHERQVPASPRSGTARRTRNAMPGTAGGTWAPQHPAPWLPPRPAAAPRFAAFLARDHQLGFSTMPSSITRCSNSCRKHAGEHGLGHLLTALDRECAPSMSTSGSTIGTMSFSWHRAA